MKWTWGTIADSLDGNLRPAPCKEAFGTKCVFCKKAALYWWSEHYYDHESPDGVIALFKRLGVPFYLLDHRAGENYPLHVGACPTHKKLLLEAPGLLTDWDEPFVYGFLCRDVMPKAQAFVRRERMATLAAETHLREAGDSEV